jgi:DNA-binding XRE family transcriptional regulator
MKSDKYRLFSRSLREFRDKSGLTQEEFAHLVGVTTSAMHKWEQGTNLPDFGKVGQLLTSFGPDGCVLLYAMGMTPADVRVLCRGFLAADKGRESEKK